LCNQMNCSIEVKRNKGTHFTLSLMEFTANLLVYFIPLRTVAFDIVIIQDFIFL
jgi:hypothetical protein